MNTQFVVAEREPALLIGFNVQLVGILKRAFNKGPTSFSSTLVACRFNSSKINLALVLPSRLVTPRAARIDAFTNVSSEALEMSSSSSSRERTSSPIEKRKYELK